MAAYSLPAEDAAGAREDFQAALIPGGNDPPQAAIAQNAIAIEGHPDISRFARYIRIIRHACRHRRSCREEGDQELTGTRSPVRKCKRLLSTVPCAGVESARY